MVCLTVATLGFAGAAHGQTIAAGETHDSFLLKAAGQSGKLSYILTELQQSYGAHLTTAPGGVFVSPVPGLDIVDDKVVIDVLAAGDPALLASDLAALGMTGIGAAGRMVSGEFPVAALSLLGRLDTVRAARPSFWVRNAGTVTSQGDAAMKADVARNTYGVTGLGVRVGIISDSFNALGGMQGSLGNELPTAVNVAVLQDRSSGTDEGRAMAEIVHDVAPAAKIAFRTGASGVSSMASAILQMSDPGSLYPCNVIVDDLLYLQEPMFADGEIAQAVDTAVSRGVVYFSSAGNYGRKSYESEWQQSGQPGQWGKPMHDFDPGAGDDPYLRFQLPTGTSFFVLQWRDAYGWLNDLASGTTVDLDLLLYDANDVYMGFGAFYGNMGQDPTEILTVGNSGPPVTVSIAVQKFTGGEPPPFRLLWIGPTLLEHKTDSPTLFGHMNAAGAIAVGAANYIRTPVFGQSPPILASYSSAGGTPIVVTAAGEAMYDLRLRPDIVAPDRGNTSFFGGDVAEDTDTYPNFSGTSASAPHAAAVVALALEKAHTHTPALIRAALHKSTIDMKESGFDWDSGYGFLDAQKALGKILCDVNASGCVDIQDLWKLYTQTLYSAPNPRYDLNGDFGVNSVDMDMIVSMFDNYGSRCVP